MNRIFMIMLIGILLNAAACNQKQGKSEITAESAIEIASKAAKSKGYNSNNTDIEILKVKNKLERGPLRLVCLVQHFPKELTQYILNNEYWVVYFYPKGQLERANMLGGDFLTMIDLYSGKVIESYAGK